MPVWMPESIQPGVTIFPPASITRAPSGAFMAPTAAIRPPRMTSVPVSIAGPDTGKIRAFVIAMISPVAGTTRAAAPGTADEGPGTGDPGRGTEGPGTGRMPS